MGKILLSLLLLCTVSGYAQPVSILHQPYAVQFHFSDSVKRLFDSRDKYTFDQAIEKMGELVHWATANHDDELANELKLIQLEYVVRERRNEDTKQQIADIISYAQAKKYKYLEANALQLFGAYLEIEKKYEQSFEQYLEAYSLYSRFSPEEFPYKKKYLCYIGLNYANNGDNADAVRILREAGSISSDNEMVVPINNAIGLQYRTRGKYDSALWYFQKIYDDAVQRNDSQWVGIAAGNIGICYYEQGEYDKAIPLLQKDIETGYVTHQVQNAINSSCILAGIYHLQHENQKAEQLLLQALAVGENKPFWPQYRLAAPIYELLSKLYAEKKDMPKAYLYLDSAIVAKDSLAAQHNALNVINANEKIASIRYEMERQELDNEKRMQTLVRNSLIAGICMLLVIGILFINSQRIRRNRLVAEKEAELKMAAAQLDAFKQSIQEKNSIIERFTGEVEKLKSVIPEQETTADVLTQLQHAIILTDEQWENFRLMFEKVHKNFFVNLKSKFPGLSQAEIRFLALTKLKMSSKEMASMLGISPNAIRMYRYRLRKKLDLDKEDMIEPLIDQL